MPTFEIHRDEVQTYIYRVEADTLESAREKFHNSDGVVLVDEEFQYLPEGGYAVIGEIDPASGEVKEFFDLGVSEFDE